MRGLLPAAFAGLIAAMPATAQDARSERIRFAAGATGTTIEARIEGYELVEYLLGARSGQVMTVSMRTDNPSSYFNIFAPGTTPAHDAAMFIGSIEGTAYEGVLPADGEYLIQVYLMRNAARRDEVANYSLEVTINPGRTGSTGADAKVAGTDFHAVGALPCTRTVGQPMGSCRFGVTREGDGSGRVTVFWPDGGRRVLVFEAGNAVGADGGAAVTARHGRT